MSWLARFRREWQRLWLGVRLRWAAAVLLIAGLMFVASALRFPNFIFGCVDLAERKFLSLADRYNAPPPLPQNIRIIYIDGSSNVEGWKYQDDNSRYAWRERHAKLLLALESAGARVVAFDLTFEDESPEFDGAFANSLAKLSRTRVVLGLPQPPNCVGGQEPWRDSRLISPALAARLDSRQVAAIDLGARPEELAGTYLRELALADLPMPEAGKPPRLTTYPTLPLQILLASLGSSVAQLDAQRSVIVIRTGGVVGRQIACRIRRTKQRGCDLQQAHLIARLAPPEWLEGISTNYKDVYEWMERSSPNMSRYQDAIVLIGVRSPADHHALGRSGGKSDEEVKVYGHQVIASALRELLSGTYLRDLGLPMQLLVMLLAALLGAAARLLLPKLHVTLPVLANIPVIGKWGLPVALLLAWLVYVTTAALFVRANILLDVVYHSAALGLAYYASGWIALAPKQRAKPGFVAARAR